MINYNYCEALLVSNLATSVSVPWEREQPTLHASNNGKLYHHMPNWLRTEVVSMHGLPSMHKPQPTMV